MQHHLEVPPNYKEYLKNKIIRKERFRKIVKNFILIIFGIILSLMLIEIGLRAAGFIIHPKISGLSIDSISKADSYRILILGESTSEKHPHLKTWPDYLSDYLNNNSSKEYIIINKATGGITTLYLVSYLEGYIKEYRPDMIITMMSINDRFSYMYYAGTPNSFAKFIEKLRIAKLSRYIYFSLIDRPTDVDYGLISSYHTKGYNDSLDSARMYFIIGENYSRYHDMNKTFYYYNLSYSINPDFLDTVLELSTLYIDLGKPELAIEILQKRLDREMVSPTLSKERLDLIYATLGNALEVKDNMDEIDKLFKDDGFAINLDSEQDANYFTRYNYNLAYNLTKRYNVKFAIMQYPTRSIKDFKDYFTEEQQKEIIFIENRENFADAMKNHVYVDLFTDNFAKRQGFNFGHTTDLGHRLIAQNAYEKLEYYFANESGSR